jgi:hypothetical protein
MGIQLNWKTVLVLCGAFFLMSSNASVFASSTLKESRSDFLTGTHSGTDLTASKEICLAPDTTNQDNWACVQPGMPPYRTYHAMAYDSKDDLFVVFGGDTGAQSTVPRDARTWIYDANTNAWTCNTSSPSPQARYSHSMAYDSIHGVVMMYGGHATPGSNELSDTWTCDAKTNTWTNQNPSSSPSGRESAAMAYDSDTGDFMLFSGIMDNGMLSPETWSYNVNTNTWTNMKPSFSPRQRSGASMVYDSQNKLMILFGGWTDIGGRSNDTWSYDLSSNTWTNLQSKKAPNLRYRQGMTYDQENGLVVLFGGGTPDAAKDTWTYDPNANAWSKITPAVSPPPIKTPAMVYDSAMGLSFMWSGLASDTNMWSFNASSGSWLKTGPLSPSPMTSPAMVFDDKNNVSILVGGGNEKGEATTWSYNTLTGNWTDMTPAVSPPARTYHSMAFDTNHGVAILFGGLYGNYLSDTWTYDFKANTWTNMNPSSHPGGRMNHKMAFDASSGKILLFGGYDGSDLSDTWSYYYPTNTWSNLQPSSSPSSRPGPGMAYDSVAKVTVLFVQTNTGSAETWSYDSGKNAWEKKDPSISPPAPGGTAMAYDRDKDLTFLYGGYSGSSAYGDTWTYDLGNDTWAQLNPTASPGMRAESAMTFDSSLHTLLLFGGTRSGYGDVSQGDTWAYDLKAYALSGNYTSQVMDTGGESYFGAIQWTSQNFSGDVKFQLRSAINKSDVADQPFIGPDGTSGSFYEKNGQRISSSHNGSQYIQYCAYLSTPFERQTPLLKNVTIEYNRLQSVKLIVPSAGDRWCSPHDVIWSAVDPDHDPLNFDILLVSGNQESALANSLPNGTDHWTLDTSAIGEGQYRIKVVARDPNPKIPLSVAAISENFTIYVNELPEIQLNDPADMAVFHTTDVGLSWNGTDANSDSLTYFVFISENTIDEKQLPDPAATLTTTSFRPDGLMDRKTYQWSVLANDGIGNGSLAPVREFSIRLNSPPSLNLTSPPDQSVVKETSVDLSWAATDPDGDSLTFFVFLSTSFFDKNYPPPAIATTTESNYTVNGLTNGSFYFWMVIPSDGKANGTPPAAWNFKVDQSFGNHAPQITSQSPVNITVGQQLTYKLVATDEDGDALTYSAVSVPTGAVLDPTTGILNWTPSATQKGNQSFFLRVTDKFGATAEQKFTIWVDEITMINPKCAIKSPLPNATVSKIITVSGTATAGSMHLAKVQFRIDGGAWQDANGTANWTFSLDTSKLKNGQHAIEVRAFDGTNYSDLPRLDINVSNSSPKPSSKGFIPGFESLLACSTILIAFAIRKRVKSS